MQSVVEAVTVQIDENGRIMLPQAMRDQMQLKPGTMLRVEATDDAELHLRVVSEMTARVSKSGIRLIAAEPADAIEDAVERDREDRIHSLVEGINP